jgi:hypothetical protein
MKTENEIIKETVEFYWADPKRRATADIGCWYLTIDGRMCAVGRCLTQRHAWRAFAMLCSVGQLPGRLLEASLDEILQPEYRGHSVEFWENLQNLHDNEHIWDSEQLLRDRLNHWFPNFPLDTLNLIRND